MEVLDAMISDAIKKKAGYKYYMAKKVESKKAKIVDKPEEQHVSPIKNRIGKGFMCYGDQLANVPNKLKKDDVQGKQDLLLSLKKQFLRQKKEPIAGEGSSASHNKYYSSADIDSDATLYSLRLDKSEGSANEIDDAEESDMYLSNDNLHGDDDDARRSSNKNFNARNVIKKNAHHIPSPSAKKIPYHTTTPQPSSLQAKLKKLMQKAKKNMRKFNFNKVQYNNDVELEYHVSELKEAVLSEAQWNSDEGDVFKPRSFERHMLKSTKPHPCFYNNDYTYLVDPSTEEKRSDDKMYEFSHADLPRLSVNDVEDMYLLQVQDMLHHLPLEFVKDFNNALLMFIRRTMIKNRVEDIQLGVESYQRTLNLTKPTMFFEGIDQRIPFMMTATLKGNKLGSDNKRLMGKDSTDYDVKSSNEMIKKIDKVLRHRQQLIRLKEYVGGKPKTVNPCTFVDMRKEFLSSRFSMKDMGEADVILGIMIKHESNGIEISQSHFIEKVLKKFNYFDCTAMSNPMDTSEKLMPNNALHGEGGKIGKVIKSSYPSIWLNIVQEVEVLKRHGIDLMSFITSTLGNGLDTTFCHVPWRGDLSFKELAPRVDALEQMKGISVAAKLSHDNLRHSLRRQPRGGAEQAQLDLIQEKIEGVILNRAKDRWTWNLDGAGEFSVASVRRTIDDYFYTLDNTKTIWVKKVPIKINIHAWKVKNDCFPTRFNMSRRGIELESILCLLCNSSAEASRHLFFFCQFVWDIMKKITRWWELEYRDFDSYEGWLVWMISIRLPTKAKKVFEADSRSGRTITATTEDMQKKKNDVKARTTLLLSLPDEHQLRFSKYKTARELWAAILKTFGDDLYNHLKVYKAEVQKKPNSNSQDMAFISSSKNNNNEDGNTVCVTTATTTFPTGSVNVATI
nr:RNA-directed DNA polymerase, eukaryota [Tanacetum cinerariifolium]